MTPERWIKVEELFHAALGRSPEERQAFLDEACGEDAALRRDVELLLAKGAQAGSFLEVSPLQVLTFGAPKSLRLARGALPGVSFLCLDEVIQLAPAVCAQQLEQAPVALQSHVAELGEVCCHPSPALL